jgi:hypothetical protein
MHLKKVLTRVRSFASCFSVPYECSLSSNLDETQERRRVSLNQLLRQAKTS